MRQEVGRRSCRMEDGFYASGNEPVTCSAIKNREQKTSLPLQSVYDETFAPFSDKYHSEISSVTNSDVDIKLSQNDSCHHGSEKTKVPAIKQHCEILCNKGRNVEQSEHSLKVQLIQNRQGTSVFSFQDAVCEPYKKQNIYHDKIDFSTKLRNGDFEPVLHRKCPSPTNKAKLDKCTKFQHISFDLPKKKKECALTSCPSLDSSLFIDPHPTNHHSAAPATHLDDPGLSSPSLHLFSLTPVIPSSGLASQASLDSGVLSNLSLDMSQNSANENWAKRMRTASSVSSGTSEMWQQSSLDGDGSALEAVSENFTNLEDNEAVFNSKMKKSERCDSLNSCLYVSSHFGNDGIEICAQTNAHNNADHSVLMPYQELEKCINNTGTVKEKPKPTKLLETTSKHAEKPIRYNINADKYFSSNLVAPQKLKRELLRERYSPEVLRKMEKYAASLVMVVINEALSQSSSLGWSIKCSSQCNQELCREDYKKKTSSRDKKEKEIQTDDKQRFSNLGLSNCGSSLCWTPEIPFSPSHRPHSRASKRSSLSFSHDSLVSGVPFQDDSHLITGAVSHDTLTFATVKNTESNKSCLLCLENDIYSLPIDMVKPYHGPILQPKVIVQQPKRRHTNRTSKVSIAEQDVTKGPTSKRKSTTTKLKRASHPDYQRESSESRTTGKRHSSQPESNHKDSNIEDENISSESASKEKSSSDANESQAERSRDIDKVDNRCTESTKLCRIMPFSSNKSHRRKEQSNSKVERKKGRSFSSNLRNTLVTLFTFRRSHKENGSCVNAKNEFIDANSQGFYESSDGLKWGKICPLPSAPPLRTSNNSAFTDHVSVVTLSSSKHPQSTLKQNIAGAVESTHTGNQRPSTNSISPASLLSCLGHPRTNSINEYDQRTRPMCETPPKCAPSSSSSKSSIVVTNRALPPLPSSLKDSEHTNSTTDTLIFNLNEKTDEGCDFASNIEKVKNYGWYWGPISGEAAEKVLSNEPDGSFIVRDSSDYHYIFSLTFRLNGVTSHVRIEHDQGNFSFGGFTRFKSQTIVDFIEKAVEHSRSGRYLFFLHRRPVLGPMRVQLLHPVSRFKHVQSLQHLCRFIIVKQVRKDLIPDLPLPQRLKDYLNSPHYYSEQVEQCMSSSSALSTDGGSPSPKSERSPSPSSSQIPNAIAKLQSTSSLQQVPRRNLNIGPSSSALTKDSTNNLFLNLRCSFPNSSSPSSHYLKQHKSKNVRLASSHSSLDTGTLQAGASAYLISSSTLSSESNSARFSSLKSYSLHRKGRFLSTSSHSSPSSPILFDLSPPDWLSSSDDNLKKISFDSSLNKKEKFEHTNSPLVEQRFTSFNKPHLSLGRDVITMPKDSSDLVASASQSSNGIVSASALQTNYIEVCNNKSSIESVNIDGKKGNSVQIIEIERNLDALLCANPK